MVTFSVSQKSREWPPVIRCIRVKKGCIACSLFITTEIVETFYDLQLTRSHWRMLLEIFQLIKSIGFNDQFRLGLYKGSHRITIQMTVSSCFFSWFFLHQKIWVSFNRFTFKRKKYENNSYCQMTRNNPIWFKKNK